MPFFPLDLAVEPGPAGELRARLTYNRDLFDADTAQRFADQFATLLEAALAAPDDPVDRLPLLADANQQLPAASPGPAQPSPAAAPSTASGASGALAQADAGTAASPAPGTTASDPAAAATGAPSTGAATGLRLSNS